MFDRRLLVTGIAMFLVAGCGPAEDPPPPIPPADPADVTAMVASANAFAVDLFHALREDGGNLVFSPFSVHAALMMTSAGAAGTTEQQMLDGLHVALPPDRRHPAAGAMYGSLAGATDPDAGLTLRVANRLWRQSGFTIEAPFLETVSRNYGAGVGAVDFRGDTEGARRTVNGWVGEQTNDRIPELFPEGILDSDTRLVLANAVYFLGRWISPFRTGATKEEPFQLGMGRYRSTPMMRQTSRFGYHETEAWQVLEMPYRGGVASMVILLPREPGGLDDVEPGVTAESLSAAVAGLKKRQVAVTMPTFTFSTAMPLRDRLERLGIVEAFTPGADFTGLSSETDLFLQAVQHEAWILVDEKGTEAAAATGVGVAATAVPEPPVVFRADHPFLFLIRDTTDGTILFLGRVSLP